MGKEGIKKSAPVPPSKHWFPCTFQTQIIIKSMLLSYTYMRVSYTTLILGTDSYF